MTATTASPAHRRHPANANDRFAIHQRTRTWHENEAGREVHPAACPLCGLPVPIDEQAVWTCPADSHPSWPGWEPTIAPITASMRERHGVYSNCGSEVGLPCYEDVPFHEACYDTLFITLPASVAADCKEG